MRVLGILKSLPLHGNKCYVIKGNCGQMQASLEGEASLLQAFSGP